MSEINKKTDCGKNPVKTGEMNDLRKKKKSIHDRRDRIYLRDIDSFHVIMPYVMPTRTSNEAVLGELFDISNLDDYVRRKNESNPDFKYTWFHVICAALVKVMILRPKMNYFISGYRMFERRDIEIAFNVKRKFEDNSEEAMAKLTIDRNGASPVEQIHGMVRDFVTKVRVHDRTEGITNQFNFFQYLPRPIFRMFVWMLKRLEYHGWYPKGLSVDDPCYSSLYVTNLGSIKMNADYHHLMEWGTNSFFVVIGEKKARPFFNEDGTYQMKNTIKLSMTIDERIADGYYFAKSLRLLRKLLQEPELLDLDANAPIEY